MGHERTLTMIWDGLGDDDEDDRFFETSVRTSSAVPLDLASSCSDDDDDEEFEDSRMPFASVVSAVQHHQKFANSAAAPAPPGLDGVMSRDYNVWMMEPGSINERRKRLFQDMGLSNDKKLLSFKDPVNKNNKNNKNDNNNHGDSKASSTPQQSTRNVTINATEEANKREAASARCSQVTLVLAKSRSDGDIKALSFEKRRKEEFIGEISKQRLRRTSSMVLAQNARINPYEKSLREANNDGGATRRRPIRLAASALTSVLSNNKLGGFFVIKNLDTGKEFVVNENNEKGMWTMLSDLQTGKQVTMEEFEKSAGYSPVVKELLRRESVSKIYENLSNNVKKLGANSYFSKSLRMSKRRGAALLKNIKGVAKQPKQSTANNWVKVRQTGKSHKELSALHLCQEIQAHEGSIWSIKFSLDARFLASAGEDTVIHVWEAQECEVLSMNEGNLTPIHPSMVASPDRLEGSEKKKKGSKGSPYYVHVPETVFSLSEKPVCTFRGHLEDVLDLCWSRSQLLLSSSMDKTVRLWDLESKSCLKLFAHNDYVTCIQFNPVDENYFLSGSLDAKVRIWSIPERLVVDWTDLHEMVTAACYTPDGQSALVGSHKGTCRMYSIEDSKLHQLNQTQFRSKKKKKKSNAKKITGFVFSPSNPSEVLVTSADSRIRILDGLDLVHKFRGFRNTSSQISASFSLDGKYVVCASEDSQVYVWKRDEHRNIVTGKRNKASTTSHEHFQCKDVSVAITWPGKVKGEPPPMPSTSKRLAKRLGQDNSSSANGSPTREEMKKHLPPLPKKNNKMDQGSEEDPALISRDVGIGESFNSNSSSIRYGDSPSISARQDDPSSLTASASSNSSSMRRGDSSFSSWSAARSWFDANHSNLTIQATAWGLVIVTATLGGEIRIYQNFGLPRRLGRLGDLPLARMGT